MSKMWVAMIMRNAEHAQTILDEWGWTKWLPWKLNKTFYLRGAVRHGKAFEKTWRKILENA